MKKLVFFIFFLFSFIACSDKNDSNLSQEIMMPINQSLNNSLNLMEGNNNIVDNNIIDEQENFLEETFETNESDNIVIDDSKITVEESTKIDENVETDEDVIIPQDECGGCNGHGKCMVWENGIKVCACDIGFTSTTGFDCIPTSTVCKAGTINYDIDGDGKNETTMQPSAQECEMFEKINYLRAVTDDKDKNKNECRSPLKYSLLWSAHGRNHSKKMYEKGGLFHDDFPNGQNVAYGSYGCGVDCELDMYMNGKQEPPCPELSHHCNIMRCWGSGFVGIGYWNPENGTYNTQNFY